LYSYLVACLSRGTSHHGYQLGFSAGYNWKWSFFSRKIIYIIKWWWIWIKIILSISSDDIWCPLSMLHGALISHGKQIESGYFWNCQTRKCWQPWLSLSYSEKVNICWMNTCKVWNIQDFFKGLTSHCKAKTTFTFLFYIINA